ncbi:MAG: ribonuclease, partial [Bryobacteraceae bacterium]|nr:ribonuclease [Bryobacteraceae bacterium]
MSKELVISSNSHETRVAIIEDDQLVEIYFQRANEYSLAGSIHKGRVTRVLPGMQSAFVDLGLERDTFLYVSDFLDEHGEEYDQVGPDEKPAIRRESVRPEPVRIPTPPASVQVLSLPATQPVESIVAAAEPVEGIGTEESKSAEEAEKRGRRSRRRRTRGRGFPDAKYASDVTRDVRPVAS